MNFNKHLDLKGQHAVFSASQSSWLRYDEAKMIEKINAQYRTALGTEMHEFAASQIRLRNKISSIKGLVDSLTTYIYRKYYSEKYDNVSDFGLQLINRVGDLPKEVYETVKKYINDGIGFTMTPEQVLLYSERFFGTTDCIDFRNNFLRIHDLKTGAIPAHMEQLYIYAALFCLEYKVKPEDIEIETRIYQANEIIVETPSSMDIRPIMEKIVESEKFLITLKLEEL